MRKWKLIALVFGTAGAVQLCNAQYRDNPGVSEHDMYEHGPLYSANEFSIEAFGTGSIGEHSIQRWSGDRLVNESRLGAGLGLNYFFTRNIGVGGDAYSENTAHSLVDSSS